MRSLVLLGSCVALAGAGGSATGQHSLWYNGDFDGVTGYASERNTELSDGRTYDSFLAGSGWVVRQVFGNFLTQNLQTSQLYFEIRRNVRPYNGGTLVSGGTVAIDVNIPTGRSGFGMEERHVLANVNSVSLADGVEYWLTVALIGNGRGRAFVVTTGGQDNGPLQILTPHLRASSSGAPTSTLPFSARVTCRSNMFSDIQPTSALASTACPSLLRWWSWAAPSPASPPAAAASKRTRRTRLPTPLPLGCMDLWVAVALPRPSFAKGASRA